MKLMRHPYRPRAFTLVELLVVLAVMAVVTTLIVSSFGPADSNRLTTAANMVADQLALARQKAITANARVEVRFYQVPSAGSTTRVYRAMRSFVVGQDGVSKPVSTIHYLPDPIAISDADAMPAQNSIFPTGVDTREDLPQSASTPYRSFSFLPGGGTDLRTRTSPNTKRQWYFTLRNPSSKIISNNLPANYVVIQVQEMTGGIRIYRP
ncbi:hypothetical protein DB346_09615 [Verrucomicrobia bacterium LW23]|nr:hypothetical protein DB346_09615 [Verrucomicrobia bacterium LW23]